MGEINLNGIFDIHSHILPEVDDGARDMEQTRRMLNIAYQEGIRGMIATPHFTAGYRTTDNLVLDQLKNRVAEIAPEGFQVFLGNELFYGSGVLEALGRGTALTLAGTRYVLVEYFPEVRYTEINKSIRELQGSGYLPVIAHVERYHCLWKHPEQVGELIQTGAYIQMNYASFGSSWFKPIEHFCRRLFDRNWVHFLGTDTHDTASRGPYVNKALSHMIKSYGYDFVHTLVCENPKRLLENKHL